MMFLTIFGAIFICCLVVEFVEFFSWPYKFWDKEKRIARADAKSHKWAKTSDYGMFNGKFYRMWRCSRCDLLNAKDTGQVLGFSGPPRYTHSSCQEQMMRKALK